MAFVETIEAVLRELANKVMLPMQQGDVVETFANPMLLKALTGFLPDIDVSTGVRHFVDWFRGWKS